MSEFERASRAERKQRELYDGLVDAVGIRNGMQCKNWVVDQQKVIALLNSIPSAYGGARHPTGPTAFKAARDGYCDPSLSNLIRNFQKVCGLPTVDGVVDPGGATFKRLQSMASGVRPGPAPGFDPQELEFYDNLDVVIRLLDLLVTRHSRRIGPRLASQLTPIKMDLERRLADRKLPSRPKKPLPVQANVGVLVIGLVVVAIIGTMMIAVSLYPPWRKAAGEMMEGIIRGLGDASQTLQRWSIELIVGMISALSRINDEAYKRSNQGCRDDFLDWERKTTKFAFELRRPKPNGELIRQAAQAWMDALMKWVKCMGPSAAVILEMLGQIVAHGQSVMDIIIKILGDNWQPPGLELRRMMRL